VRNGSGDGRGADSVTGWRGRVMLRVMAMSSDVEREWQPHHCRCQQYLGGYLNVNNVKNILSHILGTNGDDGLIVPSAFT
jgi:hypothetical protein